MGPALTREPNLHGPQLLRSLAPRRDLLDVLCQGMGRLRARHAVTDAPQTLGGGHAGHLGHIDGPKDERVLCAEGRGHADRVVEVAVALGPTAGQGAAGHCLGGAAGAALLGRRSGVANASKSADCSAANVQLQPWQAHRTMSVSARACGGDR